ncbi:pathogenesis-related protein 1-like [Triticum dicoccoides]|uniref:pathogenesis-related protein 1-like n=1 Tax=Triticum dicoccoides TaxID=85692 RepID=UPI00189089BA|nr:pathogenesis-related protein 1-like [Triticum dicoccoides]
MEYSPKLAVLLLLALASAMAVMAQNSQKDFVDVHNAARADVGVREVTWDDTVAAYAQSYAEQCRGDCKLIHTSPGGRYGENLYGGDGFGTKWTAADAVSSWAKEKQDYDHGSNTCSAICGHYTQVVWRNSTAIGCARAVCASGNGVFIICSYSPPGNYPGVSPY